MQLPKTTHSKPRRKSQIVKTLGYSVTAGLIFLGGFGIGNGTIVINKDQLLRRSIQKNSPNNLDYSSVEKVYDTLRKEYDGQLDTEKLLDGIKSGLASAAGDPYTEYLNSKATSEFNEQLNGTFSGIGAELGKDDKGNIVVIAPISGFPAEKAGLRPRDVVIEINGESAQGISITDAVSKIRGEKGTTVKLKIVRNKTEQIDLDIIRDTITIPSVESKILDGNIGYMKISRFGDDTSELANKVAREFKDKGVKGVVLDVRGNPGGLLDSSVSVSSLWLAPGKTVLDEKRDGLVTRTFKSQDTPVLAGIPTVVLIDEGSASASEITAGALHDNGVAKLFGEKSFGKGSVQQLEQLGDGSVLKVTIAKWFTPNGVNINKDGIKPDTEVKYDDAKFKSGIDNQLESAKASLMTN